MEHVRDLLNRLYPDQAYWPADAIADDFQVLSKKLHCKGFGIHNGAVAQKVQDAYYLLKTLENAETHRTKEL